MKEIQLTQGKVAIVDDEDYDWLSQWKWHYQNTGYAGRWSFEGGVRKLVFMHRAIINTPDGMISDHKNRNGLDNRRSNLRICTSSQNGMNKRASNNSISGIKGVYWDKDRNQWRVTIMKDYKRCYIGRYDKIEDASAAYKDAAKKLFGEFASC